MPPIRPRDADALGGIRRRRHAASAPHENRRVRCSSRGAMVASADPDKRAGCISRFYIRKSVQHSPKLASLRRIQQVSRDSSVRSAAIAMNCSSVHDDVQVASVNEFSVRPLVADPGRRLLPIVPTPRQHFVWHVMSLRDSAFVVARMLRTCRPNCSGSHRRRCCVRRWKDRVCVSLTRHGPPPSWSVHCGRQGRIAMTERA
jgi:hypothetical protein